MRAMSTPSTIAPATDTVIAEGPASKAAKAVAALLAVVAAVTAVLHGDHTPETLAAGAGAVVVLVTYLAGRYAQAVAIFRDSPSPAAALRELSMTPDAEELARAVVAELRDREALAAAKGIPKGGPSTSMSSGTGPA